MESIEKPDSMEQARSARDRLSEKYIDQPEISLIDIGYDSGDTTGDKEIVLRVHVRNASAVGKLKLEKEFDGFPVRIIVADYRYE